MKPRQQRMLAVGLAVGGLGIAAAFALKAFEDNMMFFVEISDVIAGKAPENRNFRVGGLVVVDSVTREPGEVEVAFTLTDNRNELVVRYDGILPDLFREGQGIIAHGAMNDQGEFIADEVLAKHDENYMPPEVAESLAKHTEAKEAAMNAENDLENQTP